MGGLDYKPQAKKEKPIEQLMVYALALSVVRAYASTTSSVHGSTTNTYIE